jgi:hypothetical protein
MMQRKLVYHPRHVQALRSVLNDAREDLHEMHRKHLGELNALRAEVRELGSILQEVVRITREKEEHSLASLRHQLEIQLARLERDPRKPLN